MQPHMRTVTILSIFIMIAASIAAAVGIFSNAGPGPYTYTSIRGQEVLIYGRGIYQHMSAEIAVQGIAQTTSPSCWASHCWPSVCSGSGADHWRGRSFWPEYWAISW